MPDMHDKERIRRGGRERGEVCDGDMNREEFRKAIERFTEGNDFMLNPDERLLEGILDGVMAQEKSFGFKMCPCRLSDGSRERNLKLLCPCNFKALKAWEKRGECWCGLFIRRHSHLR
jgi:ferredoxin-thioredoxin reductase catalytic chain